MMKLIDEADIGAPDAGALDVGHVRGGDSVDIDFAAVGVFEQAGDVQQRRFAGARRSDQRHRLAGPDRKLGALENVERGIALAKAPGDLMQEQDRLLFVVGECDVAGSVIVVVSSIACDHS